MGSVRTRIVVTLLGVMGVIATLALANWLVSAGWLAQNS